MRKTRRNIIKSFSWLLILLGIWLYALTINSAFALNPEEQLGDPALEQRARALSRELRCVVCQNQSIDDSEAQIAVDLRQDIRAQLVAGYSDQQILENLRAVYGDFILFNPPWGGHTLLLWLTPFFMVIVGAIGAWWSYRRPALASTTPPSVTAMEDIPKHTSPSQGRKLIGVIGVIGVIMVLGSAGIYTLLGSPHLPPQPISVRVQEMQQAAQQAAKQQQQWQQRLVQAQARTDAAPNNIAAWIELSLLALQANKPTLALEAIAALQRLEPDNPQWWAKEAEALLRQADGQVTVPARRLLHKAVAQDPTLVQAQYYLGIADYQDQRYAKALERWQKILAQPLLNPQWREIIQNSMRQTAEEVGLPIPEYTTAPPESIITATEMTKADILAMVARLETRLEQQPEDLAGWQMLARSYETLEQPDKMITALINVAALQPDNLEAQILPLEVMLFNGLSEQFTTPSAMLLERIALIDPEHPRYLFFAGNLARLNGDAAKAKEHWQQLRKTLPADTPITTMLQQQITQLGTAQQ